ALSAFFFGYPTRIILSYACLVAVLILLSGPVAVSTWNPALYQGDTYHFGRGIVILNILVSAVFCLIGMLLSNSSIKFDSKNGFRHGYWLTWFHIILIFMVPITLFVSLKRGVF
ncbi:MAG: hypothetical protein WAT41_08805, partial [Flavobacteriales bacterium]